MKTMTSVIFMVISLIFTGHSSLAFAHQDDKEFSDSGTRDAWLLAAIKKSEENNDKSVQGQLIMQRFADGYYIVMKPIEWNPPRYGEYSKFKHIVVPTGFITDLASIPQPFWNIAPRDGNYARAAVIHDYLYWIQDRSRDESDSILMEGMIFLKTDYTTREAIYKAVRIFGEKAWNNNFKQKNNGDVRTIKKFPGDNENYTWKEWKEILISPKK